MHCSSLRLFDVVFPTLCLRMVLAADAEDAKQRAADMLFRLGVSVVPEALEARELDVSGGAR